MERIRSYTEAIREATEQEMARDPSVFLMGLGVDDVRGLLGTTLGLARRWPRRVFDTPLSEDAMTGVAIGAALAGMRPIHTHVRMDFLMLAMNQIVNIAAKMRYLHAGAVSVPIVIRTLIGDGWGAQHSQGLHSFFAHVPGLKVVAPSTPYDAKGCLTQAIRDNNPVIFVEHFRLYAKKGRVPQQPYTLPFGRARVMRRGSDITLVGISCMVDECLRAAEYLAEAGISAEVIDPVSIAPLDAAAITRSVRKTGRLVVVDTAWTACGVSAEIVAGVAERVPSVQFLRIGFPPVPAPTTKVLEDLFYPNAAAIAERACRLCGKTGKRIVTQRPRDGGAHQAEERV